MGWLACFADLPDPRTGNATRHDLLEVLTIALVGSICGAESCVDFADFARHREPLFREFLELRHGLPSHDTFSRPFRLPTRRRSRPASRVSSTVSARPDAACRRSTAKRCAAGSTAPPRPRRCTS